MHSQGSSAAVPNLLRAVAECTQPYGPPAPAAAVRSLQVYLSDDSCVDSVYKAILARACAEPQSEAVIAKCIALVRQCVSRHPPSAAVLSAIAAACRNLAATLPIDSGVQKSLLYLQNSVNRTADSTQGGKRLAKISARSGGSSTSNKGAWPYAAASNGDLAASSSSTRGPAPTAAAAAAGGGGSVHSSASESMLGAPAARQQLGAQQPVWGSADQQQQYSWQQRQQQQDGQAWRPYAEAEWQQEQQEQQQHMELPGVRVVPSEAVLPSWTFQPSALQELWGATADAAGLEEGDLDWSALAPQLSPSLVPLVDGLPGMEELYTLRCQHVVDAITGGDAAIQLRQMREITEVRRLQAGVTPQLLQQTMQQCLAGRGRRLFQPMPYTQQEQAQVQASDVAAVVEVMCGKPSPAAPSAITGAVGLDEPDAYWQPPGSMEAAGNALQQPLLLLYQHTSNLGGAQQQQQQQRHVESIGQISSCILMKLVVDLWLTAGGAAALPLVLRMLQQALYQLQPQYRARAFDIIYNLALHGTMLMPATTAVSLPPSPALDTSRSAAPPPLSAALSPLQQQQQQQQQVYGTVDSPGGLDTQQQQAAGTYVQAGFGAAPSPPQSPSSYAAQQQQSSPGPPAVSSSWSPQPSPRARSRLSRSQLAWMAPADSLAPLQQQQQSVPPPLPLQQQGAGATGGPSASGSSNAMTGAGAAAPPPAGDGPAAGGGGSGRAARGMAAVREGSSGSEAGDAGSIGGGAAAVVPVEVAWEAWLQQLLFELLLLLSMTDEPCEAVWQAALGCLLHLTTHAGHWVAPSLSQMPAAAAAALLDACVTFHWSSELHAQLVQMAVNLLYLSDHHHAAAAQPQAGGLHSVSVGFGPHTQQQQQQQEDEEEQEQRIHEQQQQQQRQKGHWKHLSASAALASPEDVSVTLDTVGSKGSLKPRALLLQQQQQQQGGRPTAAAASSQQANSSCRGGGNGSDDGSSQLGDFDLPWQLHAGPVDEQQLTAFGGPAKLLQHFCHAGSVEGQRALLVPLLQVLMPCDAPDMAQLAVLQALCARPSCLAALQAAASAGLPGWSRHVLQAVQQQLGEEALDVPLLAALLLRLERLSMRRMAVSTAAAAIAAAAGSSVHGSQANSSGNGSSSGSGSSQEGQTPQDEQQREHEQQQQEQQQVPQLPPEVQLAVEVTLQQLRGELPSQAQPGLHGAAAFQPPPEVRGAWKALRALIWCDDDLARLASRHWLQQLLAVTLQQSLKGAILLPLPGLQQYSTAPADPASAGSAAAVAAACESWADVLQQLVVHCPQGSELLVDALQLHMASCKLRVHTSTSSSDSSSNSGSTVQRQHQQPQGPQQSEQRQRAAAARECVQAWAFVCQWVMQGRVSSSQAALTRLAAMAHSISCVFGPPEGPDVLGDDAAAAAVGAVAGTGLFARGTAAGARAARGALQTQQQQQFGPGAADAFDTSRDSMGSGPGPDSSRDFEAGFRGLPPPEPSSEPSTLAGLWAGTGARAGGPRAWASSRQAQPGNAAAVAAGCAGGVARGAAAAAAAAAAAEGVCWPQAFLLGCALLVQQMAQILSGASLALLLVRLLQVKPPSRADRGFHGRPSSSRAVAAAAAADPQLPGSDAAVARGVMPCPLLYPWSDGRQDLQLGLMLMLISSCSSDAESYTEFGLDAVTQQVLSGCSDPRACLVVSQFVLEHLMQHQQDSYWPALRQLVTAAQQANDERLLGNPFLQLVTLLSSQQQQQQRGSPGRVVDLYGRGGTAASGLNLL